MPFARPSPQEIRDRVAADVVRAMGGTGAVLRRSLEWVLARMLSIAAHELHGHLAWVARQVLPDTADDEELDRHAGIWGVTRRPAVRARGTVIVKGVAGTVIPGLVEFRRGDDARFFTDAAVALDAAGEAIVAVTASNADALSNTGAGVALQMISPLAGVVSRAVVTAAGIAGGLEAERDASLRSRIVARIQEPPHGGSRVDYAGWVREVVGSTLVWTFPNQLGRGSVVVFFVMPDGSMPSAATVALVQAHVDEVRPVTAAVSVLAPIAAPLALRLRVQPDTIEVRAAVASAVATMILREAEPGGTLAVSRLSAAISAAGGEYSHRLVQPAADVVSDFGKIARLGPIEWIV